VSRAELTIAAHRRDDRQNVGLSERRQLIPVSAPEHWPVDRAKQHEHCADHEQDYAYRRQNADARQPSD
jgi:hypothetical protein